MNLNFTEEKLQEARDRAGMAAMVDIDSFLSALDDIEALRVALQSKEIVIDSRDREITREAEKSLGLLDELAAANRRIAALQKDIERMNHFRDLATLRANEVQSCMERIMDLEEQLKRERELIAWTEQFKELFPNGVTLLKVHKYQAGNVNHLREMLQSGDVVSLRETLIGMLWHNGFLDRTNNSLSNTVQEMTIKQADTEDRLKRTEDNVLALRGELENVRKAWREQRGKSQKAREAIQGILDNPQGCPMCDAGVLRNPEKAHWDDCPYQIARSTLENANV